MPPMSKLSQTRKRIRGLEFSERTEIVEVVHTIPQEERVPKRIIEQIVDKSVPQVAGADHQGFSKPRNTPANTHVQQVVNTVAVKSLKIIKKTMQGRKG